MHFSTSPLAFPGRLFPSPSLRFILSNSSSHSKYFPSISTKTFVECKNPRSISPSGIPRIISFTRRNSEEIRCLYCANRSGGPSGSAKRSGRESVRLGGQGEKRNEGERGLNSGYCGVETVGD